MLEKINEVDWKKLKQAHGDASHVPEAVKGLISDDEEVRKRSYWLLDNYVVLQSDLYEAALYIVPFLLEILSSGIREGRELIYDLLFEIGNGYAPSEVICRDFSGKTVPLKEACKSAVLEGLSIYLAEVKDKNSPTRSKALELLASLEDKKDIIEHELKEILSKEREGEFYNELEKALQEMLEY